MQIQLTFEEIAGALPRIEVGLRKYLWLQAQRNVRNLLADAEYRRRFNGFYRVRRNGQWQEHFFALLEAKKTSGLSFAEALHTLHERTGRYEASFASKLVATIDPQMPVIDSLVLENVGLQLPRYGVTGRAEQMIALHERLGSGQRAYLATEDGRCLVDMFRHSFPGADVTEMKMLDFV